MNFLSIEGRTSKTYRNADQHAATENMEGLIPWNGQQDNLIDRFDGRALLDFYREPDARLKTRTRTSDELKLEEVGLRPGCACAAAAAQRACRRPACWPGARSPLAAQPARPRTRHWGSLLGSRPGLPGTCTARPPPARPPSPWPEPAVPQVRELQGPGEADGHGAGRGARPGQGRGGEHRDQGGNQGSCRPGRHLHAPAQAAGGGERRTGRCAFRRRIALLGAFLLPPAEACPAGTGCPGLQRASSSARQAPLPPCSPSPDKHTGLLESCPASAYPLISRSLATLQAGADRARKAVLANPPSPPPPPPATTAAPCTPRGCACPALQATPTWRLTPSLPPLPLPVVLQARARSARSASRT
jgi:hypothetical protein